MLKKSANAPSRIRFICLLGLLLMAVAVRYAFQIDIPRVTFTLIFVVAALVGDRNEIISLMMCCIPLHESVDMFFSLVSCVLIYMLKFHRSMRVNSSIMVFLLMIIWELLHCFCTSFSIVRFLGTMIPLIVLAVFMSMDISKLDYPLIVRTLAFATFGVAATLFLNLMYSHNFDLLSAVAGLKRLGIAMENSEASALVGSLINPNSLGIICVLSATGLIQIRNLKSGNRGDSVLAGAIILFGALTASRTYLVCLTAMAIFLIVSNGESIKQRVRFVGMLLVLVLLVLTVLSIVFPDLLSYYVSRFLKGDITTGRLDLMQLYHEYIMENPSVFAFGIGLQDFSLRLVEIYRIAFNAPHNAIQELIVAWGIPGIFLIAAMIFCMYRVSGILWSRKKLLNSIPLLIVLLKSLAGQMITSTYTMLALSYAYLSLSTDLTPTDDI